MIEVKCNGFGAILGRGEAINPTFIDGNRVYGRVRTKKETYDGYVDINTGTLVHRCNEEVRYPIQPTVDFRDVPTPGCYLVSEVVLQLLSQGCTLVEGREVKHIDAAWVDQQLQLRRQTSVDKYGIFSLADRFEQTAQFQAMVKRLARKEREAGLIPRVSGKASDFAAKLIWFDGDKDLLTKFLHNSLKTKFEGKSVGLGQLITKKLTLPLTVEECVLEAESE